VETAVAVVPEFKTEAGLLEPEVLVGFPAEVEAVEAKVNLALRERVEPEEKEK
jgi:hypothetical protein